MWLQGVLFFLLSLLIHAAPRPADPFNPNLRPHHGPRRRPIHTLPIIATSTILDSASTPLSTETISILTFVTPSPSAEPVPITAQSQLVTSYVPQLVGCTTVHPQPPPYTFTFNTSDPHNQTHPHPKSWPQPPPYNLTLGAPHNVTHAYPTSHPRPPPPYTFSLKGTAPQNTSHLPFEPVPTPTAQRQKRQYPTPPTPFTFNLSLPEPTRFPDRPSCTTYIPTVTPICHTTLSPLAAPAIPVTACAQVVTFSTDHGYTLLPSATAESGNNYTRGGNAATAITGGKEREMGGVKTIPSYYLAPWQAVASGVAPDVAKRWETVTSGEGVYVRLVTDVRSTLLWSSGYATGTAAPTVGVGVETSEGDSTTTMTSFETSTTTMVDTVTETATGV